MTLVLLAHTGTGFKVCLPGLEHPGLLTCTVKRTADAEQV